MALNQVLRRVTATVLPKAIRAVGSRGVAALSTQRNSFVCGQPGFLPARFRFSSIATQQNKERADEALLRVLEDEIECAKEEPKDIEGVPEDFPFEIQDTPGERTILLKRKYQDETIKIEVDAPTDESLADEEDNDDDENDVPSSIPLVVSVSKGRTGQTLEFGVTALPDEITIDSLLIKNVDQSGDELAYEGPDFGDLDENLQKSFHKYLEIRGIKPSTANFLFEYMTTKDNREYFQWLQNLKNFVEK